MKLMLLILFAMATRSDAAPGAPTGCPQGSVPIRSIELQHEGRWQATPVEACMNPETLRLRSVQCENGETCMAAQALKRAGKSFQAQDRTRLLHGGQGNPGFHVCKELGGVAQIVRVAVDGRRTSTDRCVFAQDGSFVSSGEALDAVGFGKRKGP